MANKGHGNRKTQDPPDQSDYICRAAGQVCLQTCYLLGHVHHAPEARADRGGSVAGGALDGAGGVVGARLGRLCRMVSKI